MDGGYTREEYVRRVLDAYRVTPGTTGTVRRPDRMTATELYRRGVPATVVENAFVLAATRRLCRPPGAMPLRHDPFARLFPAGDRRNTRRAHQPGLLPLSPLQTPSGRRDSIIPTSFNRYQTPDSSARMMNPNRHACGVDDDASPSPCLTPSADDVALVLNRVAGPVLNFVPDLGQSNRAEVGHFSRAPKHKLTSAVLDFVLQQRAASPR